MINPRISNKVKKVIAEKKKSGPLGIVSQTPEQLKGNIIFDLLTLKQHSFDGDKWVESHLNTTDVPEPKKEPQQKKKVMKSQRKKLAESGNLKKSHLEQSRGGVPGISQIISLISGGDDISIKDELSEFASSNLRPDKVVSLKNGAGISVSGSYPNFTVANSSPDKVVSLKNGAGISVSGSYPNFTVANSSPDKVVSLKNGAGISVSGSYPDFTISATGESKESSDKVVSLKNGAGISVSGSYPNFTLTNSSPDRVISLRNGVGISVSGNYPNFIVTNSSPNRVVSLKNGTGISVSGNYPNFIVTNSSPDKVVSLKNGAGISVSGSYPNFTISATTTESKENISLESGAGISVSGSYPKFTISATTTESKENISLISGKGISVSGSYPKFTINNTSTNKVISIKGEDGILISGSYPNFIIKNTKSASSNAEIQSLWKEENEVISPISTASAVLGVSPGITSDVGIKRCLLAAGESSKISQCSDSTVLGSNAICTHNGCFLFSDSAIGLRKLESTNNNQFGIRCSGGSKFYSNTANTTGVTLAPHTSSWAAVSDVNKKENLKEMNYHDVMEKVSQIKVYQYNFKGTHPAYVNIGPTAQDWHSKFGTKTIKTPVIDSKTHKQKSDPKTGDLLFEDKPAKDPLMIEDRDMIGVLFSCVKFLRDENISLKSENSKLQEKIQSFDKQINDIKQHLGME